VAREGDDLPSPARSARGGLRDGCVSVPCAIWSELIELVDDDAFAQRSRD